MKNVLIVPDLHCPFVHPDSIKFLSSVCSKYIQNPDLVIFLGDEIDGHAFSYHEKSADALYTPKFELLEAIECLKEFYKLFPKAVVLESNHGSLLLRKANTGGIPSLALKSYNDILEAPESWHWVSDYVFDIGDRRDVYFHHGKRKTGMSVAVEEGMRFVQGHFHTEFSYSYHWKHPIPLWTMTCGCLIDNSRYAFEYAKNYPRPKLGCGLIINRRPMLIPMNLKSNGRWDGKIT